MQREASMSEHKGFTAWFTGLPCSGKTTVADRVAVMLRERGHKVERLDGDIVRKGLTSDLGFSKQDRDENIRRVTYLAAMLTRNGVVAITSFISPYRELREQARREIGRFVEVYVRCPVEVCIQRDSKGMYKKALAGEISDFTGVSDPYEEPLNPELVVDSDKETVDNCAKEVLSRLRTLGYLDESAMPS